MDYADAALAGDGDCHVGLGDGVHSRRDDGDIEVDVAREAGVDGHHVRSHLRVGGNEEHIVECHPFLRYLFIYKRHITCSL